MYKNYEKRVKDFITEMANPSSQIVITDITEKVNNCRAELMNESKMQKPFIFKGYITEQDRINDTIRNHKLLFNLPDYPENKSRSKSKSKEKEKDKSFDDKPPKINFHIFENENEKNKTLSSTPSKIPNPNLSLDATRNKGKIKYNYKKRMSIIEKNQIKALIKKDSILQPQMRFTARTDLERVYDALNGDYIKRNEREIIERQLKHIRLFNYKKPKEMLKADSYNEEELEEKIKIEKSPIKDKKKNKNIKNIYGPSNVYYEAKNNDRKIWARKDNLNLEARGLLSSYHIKTHFKATEEIAEYKPNSRIKAKETCFLLPHLLPKNYRYQILNTDGNISGARSSNNSNSKSVNIKKIPDYSKLEDTRKLFNFDKDNEKDEINDKNDESNYNMVNNPILMGNKINVDPHSLNALSKLAFKTVINEDDDSNDNNEINILNNGKDKNYDQNRNQNDDKNNLNQVAKKILNECNVYAKKSKFNNSSHKSKGGKTMITKGLTLEEFENKYKLNI